MKSVIFITRSFRNSNGTPPSAGTAHFSNSALHTAHPALTEFMFANQIEVDSHGWAQLAPFGEYPGQALLKQADGSILKFEAIQRFDLDAAQAMVAKFKSPWHRLKRYFTGCPIFVGHPDVPALANASADKTQKGMIVDLQAREDGLYCKPVFTAEGSELVENKKLRAFSAYWSAVEIGHQSDGAGNRFKIYRPSVLKSAGLTNHPNLPVKRLDEGINRKPVPANAVHAFAPTPSSNQRGEEQPQEMAVNNESQFQTQQIKKMNRQTILDFLTQQGITLANEATDEQITTALQSLGARITVAETAMANSNSQIETLNTELANERNFHIDTLLGDALREGCITAAQRPDWVTRLAADFVNESAALAKLAPVLKTHAVTLNLGARKAEIANATERRDVLDTLVKNEMAQNGGDYDRAFAAVQKSHPALFSAMKQPQQA